MSSLIEKQQDFKGSINEVPFEREEVFDATASVGRNFLSRGFESLTLRHQF